MPLAESGLFCGFFLPGDPLLVTAGLLASTQRPGDVHLSLVVVLIGCSIAAIAGDQVGYAFGARVGPALFKRPHSKLFKPGHLTAAQRYLDTRGARMIVLARFVPAVRTFTPIAAGAVRMRYRLFVPLNVVGGLAWVWGVTLAGYLLVRSVASIDRYLLPVIAVVVAISLVPVGLEIRRARRVGRSASALGDG